MTATVAEVRPAPPSRRDRVAMGWVAAVAASAFGDTAWLVALAWTAVQVLDPAAAGLVVGVGTLPQAALMLTGGVLADRHDPRRVVALGEAGRAAVLVAGALAWWSGAPAVVVLPGVALALGAVAGLTQPALQTMTRLLVRPDDLPTVMGWSQIAQRLARLAGAPVGAWLVVAAGPPVDDAPRRRDLRRGRRGGRDRTPAVRPPPHHRPRPGGAPGGDAPPLDDAPDPGAGAGDLRPQRVHRTGAHAGRPAPGQRGRLAGGLARGGRGGLRLRRDRRQRRGAAPAPAAARGRRLRRPGRPGRGDRADRRPQQAGAAVRHRPARPHRRAGVGVALGGVHRHRRPGSPRPDLLGHHAGRPARAARGHPALRGAGRMGRHGDRDGHLRRRHGGALRDARDPAGLRQIRP